MNWYKIAQIETVAVEDSREQTMWTKLQQLAADFVSKKQIDLRNTEGKCAKYAEMFSNYLNELNIPNQIIDAREYKGSLTTVGGSNHVLVSVGDEYADFTTQQFGGSQGIIVDTVANLNNDWDIVNTYSNYSDFLNNFTKEQKN